jgi:aminomethyltransferase
VASELRAGRPQGVICGRALPHAADTLRRTPLFDRHEQAGAKLVPFAGWEMPVQYEGIRQEHVAVRTGAGMFDVSHMGQIETSGPDAEAFLQRILSNDVSKIAERGAQYSVLCRKDGGVLDDLFTYRLDGDRYLTVTNAANHAKDLAWFREQANGFDVELRDAHADWAMLAVQGPEARRALAEITAGELPKRMGTAEVEVAGVEALVCGTGYTGEDGCELMLPPDGAGAVWDALLERRVQPAGLGARDTLRLEVCFHLYGNDLSEERNPIEAGLGWCCKLDTGFVGADALREVEPRQTLVPFAFTGPGIPRHGNPVNAAHGEGVVTSGSLSPCLEIGIGMAYLPLEDAEPGTSIEVDVRGKPRPAEVRSKPLLERKRPARPGAPRPDSDRKETSG